MRFATVRYYEVTDPGESTVGFVEGRHKWRLPTRIGCPTCGVYAAVGASHPTIDLTTYPEANLLTDPPGVSWRQFQEMAGALAQFLGSNQPLGPGDEFGSFAGHLKGSIADFLFGDLGLIFATEETLQRLNHSDIELPASTPAELRNSKSAGPAILELDLPRAGRIAAEGFQFLSHRCTTCGRIDGPLDRLVLVQSSIPERLDLFRASNGPIRIIASERFRLAVASHEFSGMEFRPIEFSESDV